MDPNQVLTTAISVVVAVLALLIIARNVYSKYKESKSFNELMDKVLKDEEIGKYITIAIEQFKPDISKIDTLDELIERFKLYIYEEFKKYITNNLNLPSVVVDTLSYDNIMNLIDSTISYYEVDKALEDLINDVIYKEVESKEELPEIDMSGEE